MNFHTDTICQTRLCETHKINTTETNSYYVVMGYPPFNAWHPCLTQACPIMNVSALTNMQYGNLLVAFNDLCDMAHTSSCSLLILNFASIYSSFSLSYKSFYTSFFSSPVDIFHMLIINFSFSLNILLATFNLLISNFKINITFCESPFALLCSGYFKKKKKNLTQPVL